MTSWLCQQTANPHPHGSCMGCQPHQPSPKIHVSRLQQSIWHTKSVAHACALRKYPRSTLFISRGETITRWPHCRASAHMGALGLSVGVVCVDALNRFAPAQTPDPTFEHTASAHKHLHSTSNTVTLHIVSRGFIGQQISSRCGTHTRAVAAHALNAQNSHWPPALMSHHNHCLLVSTRGRPLAG